MSDSVYNYSTVPYDTAFRAASVGLQHCSSWIFNDSQLQSVASIFCGNYFIYFCLLHDRGINMCKFISNFTSDTELNDILVHASVRRRLYKRVFFGPQVN